MSVNEEGLTTGSCIAAGEGEVGRHAVTGEAQGPFVGQKLGGIPGSQGCPFSPKWRGRGGMDRMVEGSVGPVRLGSPPGDESRGCRILRESAVACRPNGASIDDRGPSREPAKNQAGSFNERQGPQTSS
ncbi:hypothetical protein BGZ61DRAFT_472247 [Ilyonectria robusta]|uniref:uncharacterized protein n=1 Tax=Ilyonectria robusta TaxID=1079257 RepID=UPI001E8ED9F6|nr:uncharacterized protein BGZ61DRAFT_472247 [Ilyonectria robusta]KAH8735864.1 hypothetical protein BGZ61DRAFT_472247 [Ilyonectria robusta]